MNWLQHLVNGNISAARMLFQGIQRGDTVYIDTQTAPTESRECVIKATISKVHKDGTFDTHESEPYFGYNKNWHTDQIIR